MRVLSLRSALLLLMVLPLCACSQLPTRVLLADDDGDNVPNASDACADTAVNRPVDAKGCSLFDRTLHMVVFRSGDHQLNVTSRDALADLLAKLKRHPEVVIWVEGHTDNRGSAKGNLALSKRRVMSVVRYLVANGISADRLKPIGFGENRPIASNSTPAGRNENRRIDISVFTP